ncbi:cyclic nucleotide-binding domain-containing protein [Hymenobacter yonginensis]|uniref:Cyclic nucleotide-binding domain-containing protein n=1 Tax=Hymenobacter yonginensis TaxID=748197 RepID=A0ABY7PMF6_9BACT|nr:cyclic nucleotide-binding domain-containing protein [Hymenobacter yonginensis]WBO83951.1 cyclic nucleotide-binding domain-containing protein [Hymenobacter yonginensis]
MNAAQYWHRLLGIRTPEATTVWLFFLHHFLLGAGTMLVYVTASVVLLESHPDHSLPLSYLVAALALVLVGRAYARLEHRLSLRYLAVWVLVAVLLLTGGVAALLLLGHSLAAVLALVVGYRLIYLLTNLEFWGLSALVFDVRQSKRLFSLISAGDLPAKALGAVLATTVYAHAQLTLLLATALLLYASTFFTLRAILRRHPLHARHVPARPWQPAAVSWLPGGTALVRAMGLGVLALAAVMAGTEYLFFVNVKQRYHHSTDLIVYIGQMLAITYLLATVFKLLVSRPALERLGARWALAVLPLALLVAVLLFVPLRALGLTENRVLLYCCTLYLLVEVLRRAVFDPIFLVLLQPLSAVQRLQGHTMLKGLYEPLGMALAGGLFLGLPLLGLRSTWGHLVWMGLLLLAALWLLHRAYQHYLAELHEALELRFIDHRELALPATARALMLRSLGSPRPAEVLPALQWLQVHFPEALAEAAPALLHYPNDQVRSQALLLLPSSQLPPELLHRLATSDPAPHLRQAAAQRLGSHPLLVLETLQALLNPADVAACAGALHGRLATKPNCALAQESLARLLALPTPAARQAALGLSHYLPASQQAALLHQALRSPDPGVVQAGLRAVLQVPAAVHATLDLAPALLKLLPHAAFRAPATACLVQLADAALPHLRQALRPVLPVTPAMLHLPAILGRIGSPASRLLLLELVQRPALALRAVALRALRSFHPHPTDRPLFKKLLREEITLAHRLLRGLGTEPGGPLAASLAYELASLQQRIFGLLVQLYETTTVVQAQRNLAQASPERRANALELLDNVLPRSLYLALQAVLDDHLPPAEKARLLNDLLPPLPGTEALSAFVVRQGEAVFSAWTLSMALRHWQPTAHDLRWLRPYLHSSQPLLQESALLALNHLRINGYAHFQQLLAAHPSLSTYLMHPASDTAAVSIIEQVLLLKSTALFAETPENVLTSIVAILQEVSYADQQLIFRKGELGACLFVVYAGEVDILDGPRQLARFGKGECFGELALFDAEPRSASAVAAGPARLFRLDQEDFYELMEERGEVLRNVVRVLCQRLRRQNEMVG